MNASFFYFPKNLRRLGYILALSVATSCGVYVPHVPPTPILAPGKVEMQAAVLPMFLISKDAEGFRLTRPVVQGYVAYSPINHLFVTATGGGNAIGRNLYTQTYGVRERQGDIGVGAYTWLSAAHKLYMSGMLGIGSGQSSRIFSVNEWGIFSAGSGGVRTSYLGAKFNRQFAQGQLSLLEGAISYTGFLRVAKVRYDILDEFIFGGNGYAYTIGSYYGQSLPPTTLYMEMGYAIRLGQGAWSWTLEGTFSGPLTRHQDFYDKAELPYNTSLVAVGVVWRPGRVAR